MPRTEQPTRRRGKTQFYEGERREGYGGPARTVTRSEGYGGARTGTCSPPEKPETFKKESTEAEETHLG